MPSAAASLVLARRKYAATASPCVNCQTARYWHMEDKPLTLATLAFLALLTLAGIAGAVNYLTPP